MNKIILELSENEMQQLIFVVNESPVARRVTDPIMVQFDHAIQKFNDVKLGILKDATREGDKVPANGEKVAKKWNPGPLYWF